MPLKPPEDFESEDCAKDHPNGLYTKIVAVDSGHDDDMPADKLEIYFSNNYGEDFYNPDTPREAVRRDVFSRRLLEVKEKGEEEEKEEEDKAEVDESLSRSPIQSLEGRKLFAAFHEDSRRRLCTCNVGSIVEVAEENGFDTLVEAAEAAGLDLTSNEDEPYTVFGALLCCVFVYLIVCDVSQKNLHITLPFPLTQNNSPIG